MKLHTLLLSALALTASFASAQTAVTGTITDKDGFSWADASVLAKFFPTNACPAISVGATYPVTANTSGVYLPTACSANSAYNPTTDTFTAPSTYGGEPLGTLGQTTTTQNRDLPPNQEGNPSFYNSAGLGTNENGDDCDKIVQQIYLAASQTPGTPRVVKLGGRHYRCTAPHGYALLPRDYGDYLSTSSGTGAFVSLNIVSGKVTGCTVSGGTGYNPNAYLPVQIVDVTYRGSGASVYVQTNSRGVPSNCTVEFGGVGYPQYGVLTRVFPVGADGATGYCTLTSGTMGTCTVSTEGNGYTSFPASGFPIGSTLLQCSSIPTIGGTVSGGQVATLTSTAGSGCAYNSASSATVPVCIGGCVRGVQATNLKPEAAQEIGIAIPLLKGTTIDCEGGYVQADYLDGLANTSELAVFGDPWGDQAEAITVKNCNIGGFADFWFAGPVSDVFLDNNHYAGQPKGGLPGVIASGPGSAIGIYMPQVTQNVRISNSIFLGNVGALCGGIWSSRTGGNGGTGSLGGTDVSAKSTVAAGGSCNGLSMENNSMYQAAGNHNNGFFWPNVYLPPLLNIQHNQYNRQLDLFVEQYLWKSQNSPLTNVEAPNGQGTCYSTLTSANRAIDWNFGNIAAKASTDPWFPCYRGISDMAIVALSRNGSPSSVRVANLNNTTGSGRPLVLGSFTNSEFTNFNLIHGRTYADPYLPASTKQEGIIVSQTATTSTNRFGGIYAPSGVITKLAAEYALGISVTTLASPDITGSLWSGIISLNSQPSFNLPTFSFSGAVKANYLDCTGSGNTTLGVLSGAGSGATITPTSSSNFVCGGNFTLVTGTSPSAGAIFSITFPKAFANSNFITCTANLQSGNPYPVPSSPTVINFDTGTALPASTSLKGTYTCSY